MHNGMCFGSEQIAQADVKCDGCSDNTKNTSCFGRTIMG